MMTEIILVRLFIDRKITENILRKLLRKNKK